MKKSFVFVYGTLKRGCANHVFLENEEFICETKTINRYTLLNLLRFPGLIDRIGKTQIHGEVYKISNKKLKELDKFEGSYYYRKKILVEFGMYVCMYVWTYFLIESIHSYLEIDGGIWIE